MNVVEGELRAEAGGMAFHAPGLHLAIVGRSDMAVAGAPPANRAVSLGVRPEHVGLAPAGASCRAAVERVERLGGETLVHLRGAWGSMISRVAPASIPPEPGASVGVTLDPAHALFFDRDSGTRIASFA